MCFLLALHSLLSCRHNHMEETKGKHWCRTQTTILPAAPRARRVCVQSTEPLRYQLDDLTRQRIAALLDAV